MKLYRLLNSMKFQGELVSVQDNKARYVNWIVNDREDMNFIKYPAPSGRVSDGIDCKAVLSVDYLESSISAPLFSVRAKEIFYNILKDELDFIKCDVFCGSNSLDFYFGRVIKTLPLIDTEKSECHEVLGHKILSKIQYNSISQKFYIAKDIKRKDIVIVSELFVDLVRENDLNIDFIDL